MGNAEELERLVALKEKGALTEEEFQKAKGDLLTPKKRRRIGRTIVTWAFGLFFAYAAIRALLDVFGGSGGIPTCNSGDASNTLMQAFDTSQFARSQYLTAIEVVDARAEESSQTAKIRKCVASLRLNNTEIVPVKYEITAQEGGKYRLTFQVDDKTLRGSTERTVKERTRERTAGAPNPRTVTIVGRVGYATLDSAIESPEGASVGWVTNSAVNRKISAICNEGDVCEITGVVYGSDFLFFESVAHVRKVK